LVRGLDQLDARLGHIAAPTVVIADPADKMIPLATAYALVIDCREPASCSAAKAGITCPGASRRSSPRRQLASPSRCPDRHPAVLVCMADVAPFRRSVCFTEPEAKEHPGTRPDDRGVRMSSKNKGGREIRKPKQAKNPQATNDSPTVIPTTERAAKVRRAK
jgi:hypothetical protein